MGTIIGFVYLAAAIIFILGIRQLTKVKTARRGNLLASLGMFIAVIATLINMQLPDPVTGTPGSVGWSFIISGILIGGVIGIILSRVVKMTAMPQLVAVFNGLGGGASSLVALSYVWFNLNSSLTRLDVTTVVISLIIGTVTFTGSFIAFGKLQGLINGKPIIFKGNKLLNLLLFLVILGHAYLIISSSNGLNAIMTPLLIMVAVTALLGILLVTPIGGADMPVVISLLNSYSGLAAAATGFVLKNLLLIIGGALVGASGIILTKIMCKAMNRSLLNVIFGGFGQEAEKSKKASEYKTVKETSPEEAAMIFDAAKTIIVVPGYGMAVAQAQHGVKELMNLLENKGAKVTFAIHPVAGRMPGHMNVLLAEADVPYEQLKDLDHVNNDFKNADIALIIGANDVVNPAASKDKSSPIYGMPVLKADEAKTVFVVKRSLSPGFAGIKNELFEQENTLMLFGDAEKVVSKLTQEIQEL